LIERLRDALAPPRAPDSETGYRRLLRWAALPITDRHWAAPLSAIALGFGLFAGVAIGPGAAGTLATAPFQIIEMPSLAGGGAEEGEEEELLADTPESGGGFGGEEESPAFAPIVPVEEAAFEPAPEEPAGDAAEPQNEKEPAEPEDQVLAGTVVHVNPAASSYTVAEAGGVMSAVHAGKLPAAGAQVEVPIRVLANGTLAEAGKRVKTGTKNRAKLAGIVTYVAADPAAPGYAVSNQGTSLFVHVDPDPAGVVPPLPVLGAYASLSVGIEAKSPADSTMSGPVDAPSLIPPIGGQGGADAAGEVEPVPAEETPPPQSASVDPAPPAAPLPATTTCAPDPSLPPSAPIGSKGTLRQRSVSAAGAPFTHADFEGIVAAVCPVTAQLLISADDVRAAGHDLLFTVPAGIDTAAVAVGESVLASADIAADGSLSLTGLASDERSKGADNAKATQGDLVPAKGKGQE
jgi:hypothetical protein